MKRLLRQLFGRTPREFATPQRKTVETFDQLLAAIDQHNGLTDCYTSAYAFGSEKRDFTSAVINKAVFDFDGEWDALVDTHEWLAERGAAHFAVFSGSERSGHIYVLTEPTTHDQSLEYFQRDVVVDGVGLRKCERCGVRLEDNPDDEYGVRPHWCDGCGEAKRDSDARTVVDDNLAGDPTTHVRIPNTWHPRAERFCIPLRPGEVTRDADAVAELAGSQRDLDLSDIVSGERPVDLEQARDRAEEKYRSYAERQRLSGFAAGDYTASGGEAQVSPVDMHDTIDCECVLSMLPDRPGRSRGADLGHDERRVLVSTLVEKGYNPAEISAYLRWALTDEKARHSVVEERQPERLFRDAVKPPNAMSMKRDGHFDPTCPVHSGGS